MNNTVISTIEKYSLIEYGDSVVIALSGGADSVTLLDILNSIKEKYSLKIYAAHLNHNIRGEEAERDESFCKILCKNYNIQLFTKSVDIRQLSKERRISEELCGRDERYKFFAELSSQLNAKIATAHTASDNAETLLFNIARGTSVKGLAAIPPKRGNIIRPLIELSRSDIEAYCKERNLKYVTDTTNLTDDYTRNRLRHNVIPELKRINPQLEHSVLRLSENAREISDYLDRQTYKAIKDCKTEFGYSCNKLLSLDRAILKNAIAEICRTDADFSPESRHIDLLESIIRQGGAVNLNKAYRAVSKQGIFRIVPASQNVQSNENTNSEFPLKNNSDFEFNGKIYKISEINSDKENKNSVSSDILKENAVFRTRREKDRFTYPQRNITKPLRKVLNEQKIPSELRDKLLVLAVGSTILWCEMVGASKQGKNNSEKEINITIINKS